MARNTRRRAAQQRNQKVLDILNNVAENQDDGDAAHTTNIDQHIDTESVDHDHGDDQRPTRRSARLNKRAAREVTPVTEKDVPEAPYSPLFMPSDSEAEEDNEAEEESKREEDDESLHSEHDTSIPDHEQQLWQEQEQAIANSQQEQEQEQELTTSPVLVVINRREERMGDQDATTARAAETKTARAKANHADFSGGDDEFADGASEQEDENADDVEPRQEDNRGEEPAPNDNFDMDDSRHDVGAALKGLFDWGNEQPAEPTQRTRLVDQLETQHPQTRGSPSRKRRRASNDSTDMPDRTRRRRESQNQDVTIAARRRTPIALPIEIEVATSPEIPIRTRRLRESREQNIESAASRRPPVARGSPEAADWEATILEEGTRDEVIVVAEHRTFDDATKIHDLQGTWKRLIRYCQKLKDIEVRRTRRYIGIEAIVERIGDLLKDYKRMQRKRLRGWAIDPNTWKRTRQEVKYLGEDADQIRKVVLRRAKEGKENNDLQAQADAIEYAELIVQQVMTSLCQLALECLRTYYSEEDEWLLKGGFGAVLDIIDIVGELDLTLTSLHNCAMVVLSPYPGRPIRQELRSIRGSLAKAEADEQRRGW
ncbi:hypothetical protein TMatcc_006433 [Talaromyces marneffei ATCC 18224]|uniref:Uncharacterized protein n=2 Tax=Talaromyces marneffei TaxID=37727 RepID=B6QB01_TALMQ|nr:hypothetical protein PMAA_064570 [Talaromyces marneffei ATCC 18224]KAE8554075.1 hypothetical protein EYB25_002613 [Talaromyces marneffei]